MGQRPIAIHALRAAAVALLVASAAAAQEPSPRPPPEATPPGDEPPAPAPLDPATQIVGNTSDPVRASSSEGTTWADDSHRSMEQGLDDLTVRLDRLFGEYRRLDVEQPGTYLRWRSELRADDRGGWTPRVSLRASLQLPAFHRWIRGLQLVFAGESRGDPTVRRLEQPGDPGLAPSIQARQASLELRVDLLRTRSTTIQAATGLRLRLPLEYFGALRYFHRFEVGGDVTLRFTQTGDWTSRERFGETTLADLDRPLGEDTQVRWNNAGFITGVSRGYEWGTELGLAHEFRSLRLGTYLAFGASGYGVPSPEVELFRIYQRFRRDLWRRWLFVELEPEVSWPLVAGRGRPTVLSITVRLDVILDARAPKAMVGAAVPPRPAAPAR